MFDDGRAADALGLCHAVAIVDGRVEPVGLAWKEDAAPALQRLAWAIRWNRAKRTGWTMGAMDNAQVDDLGRRPGLVSVEPFVGCLECGVEPVQHVGGRGIDWHLDVVTLADIADVSEGDPFADEAIDAFRLHEVLGAGVEIRESAFDVADPGFRDRG